MSPTLPPNSPIAWGPSLVYQGDRIDHLSDSNQSTPPKGFRLSTTARCLLTLFTATGLGLSIADASHCVPPPNSLIVQQHLRLSQPTQILYVSATTGNDQGQGNQQSPFQTITRALQSAQPNTAIILATGTYSEQTGEQFPLMLRPNVTIQGNPNTKGEDIVIYGGGFYTSRTSAKQNIAILGANGARVSGVTITNPYERGYGLWIESASLIVSQNTFTGNTHDGISVVGMGAALIQNNIFRENGANGITVFGSSRPEIRENEFQNTGFGINIAQQAAPFIVGNRIIYNKDGVVIQGNARPVLRENYIERNQRDGIVAIAQGTADLGHVQEAGRNVIQNNGRYDVHNGTKGQPIVAHGNQLSQNKIAGRVDWGGSITNPPGLNQQFTTAAESNASRRSPINAAADLPVFVPDPNTALVPNPDPVVTTPTSETNTAIPIPVPPPEPQQQPVATQLSSPPRVALYNSVRPTLQPVTSAKTEPTDESSDLLSQLRSQAANAIEIPVPAQESNQTARRVIYPLSTQPALTTPSAVSSGVLPVPGSHIPVSDRGYLPSGLDPRSTSSSLTPLATTLLGLQYRVIVEDISESTYQQVRQFVPEAFRTVVKDRSVIQVGAFRDRAQANRVWRRLNQNRIPAKIEPFN